MISLKITETGAEIAVKGNMMQVLSELTILARHIKQGAMQHGMNEEEANNLLDDAIRCAKQSEADLDKIVAKFETENPDEARRVNEFVKRVIEKQLGYVPEL